MATNGKSAFNISAEYEGEAEIKRDSKRYGVNVANTEVQLNDRDALLKAFLEQRMTTGKLDIGLTDDKETLPIS